MSFQSGSFRVSPQDASMHSEFRHTIQRAIDRIHKPTIQSSTSSTPLAVDNGVDETINCIRCSQQIVLRLMDTHLAIAHGIHPHINPNNEYYKISASCAAEQSEHNNNDKEIPFNFEDDGFAHPWDFKGKKFLRDFEGNMWFRRDDPMTGEAANVGWAGKYNPITKIIDTTAEEPEYDDSDDDLMSAIAVSTAYAVKEDKERLLRATLQADEERLLRDTLHTSMTESTSNPLPLNAGKSEILYGAVSSSSSDVIDDNFDAAIALSLAEEDRRLANEEAVSRQYISSLQEEERQMRQQRLRQLSTVESDQKYEHDVEPFPYQRRHRPSTVKQEQKPATITFEDILGMDKMELEQLRSEKSNWKLEKELLWKTMRENMFQSENMIRTLKKENKELEDAMKDVVERSIKESNELRRELGYRRIEGYKWRKEMISFRESLVKHHIVYNGDIVEHRFIAPHSTYVDDVLKTIAESIQAIEKTEIIMNIFYCSFDEVDHGDLTRYSTTIYTYAKMYLITNKHLYELHGYHKGKSWLEINPSTWDARGICLRGGTDRAYLPKNLEYGSFYRFNPVASVHSDVNWYTLSVLINSSKGNIGRSVGVSSSHNYNGYQPREIMTDKKRININSSEYVSNAYINQPAGVILEQTAERYVKNIIELVTE
jgi:hypothetical protein